ncbi:hypothetical protein PVAG01_09125 [Phlyctema vagabunda]|uniref:Uncharacterized protein n=1 Tax=Phlyctema vagabunda TaxID=108571 RepID=A0ABR4P6H8_9HELO
MAALAQPEDIDSWIPTGWRDNTNNAEEALLPYLALGFRPQVSSPCQGRLAGCTAFAMSLWAVQDLTWPNDRDNVPDEGRWTAQQLYVLFEEESYRALVEQMLAESEGWFDLSESSCENLRRAGVPDHQLPSEKSTKPWWREQFYLEQNFGSHQLQLIVKILNNMLPAHTPYYALGIIAEGWRGSFDENGLWDADTINPSTAELHCDEDKRSAAIVWTTPCREAVVAGWDLEKRWTEDAMNNVAIVTSQPALSSHPDMLEVDEGHFVRKVFGPKNQHKKRGHTWVRLSAAMMEEVGGNKAFVSIDQGWVRDDFLQEISLKENGHDNYKVGNYKKTAAGDITYPDLRLIVKNEKEAILIDVAFSRVITPTDKARGMLSGDDAYAISPLKPGTLLQLLTFEGLHFRKFRDIEGQQYKLSESGTQRVTNIWGLPDQLPVIGEDLSYAELPKQQFTDCVKAWSIRAKMRDKKIQEMIAIENNFTGMGLPLRRLNAFAGTKELPFYKGEIVLAIRHVIIEQGPRMYVLDYQGYGGLVEHERLDFIVDNSDIEEYEFSFNLVFQRQSLMKILETLWEDQLSSLESNAMPWQIISDEFNQRPHIAENDPTGSRMSVIKDDIKGQEKSEEAKQIKAGRRALNQRPGSQPEHRKPLEPSARRLRL